MFSRDGSSTLNSNLITSGLALALFGLGAGLFVAGTAIKRIESEPNVAVDLRPWAWMRELQVGLDRGVTTHIERASTGETYGPPIKVQTRSRARVARIPARKVSVARVSDRIKSEAAAPGIIPVVSSPASPASDESEHQRLQRIHASLRSQWVATLSDRPEERSAVLAVSNQRPTAAHIPARRQKPKLDTRDSRRMVRIASTARSLAPAPLPVPAPPAASSKKPVVDQLVVARASPMSPVAEEFKSPPAQDSRTLVEAEQPEEPRTPAEARPVEAWRGASPVAKVPEVAALSEGKSSPPASVVVQTVLSRSSNDYSGPVDYSIQFGPSAPQPEAAHMEVAPKVDSHPNWSSSARESAGTVEVSSGCESSEAQDSPPSAAPYIEALEPSIELAQAKTESLTVESEESSVSGSGWRISEAPLHMPTVHWSASHAVPLFSNNTLLLLSKLSATEIQPSSGLVFGSLPDGWTVEFSARSDRVLILNESNALVPPTQVSGERRFVFLNAAPGAHLLYLSRSGCGSTAAVAMPVLPGRATYVDVSRIRQRRVAGRVFDASSSAPVPIPGAQVRVVGQAAVATTGKRGDFEIRHVLSVGPYPLYLETETANGFTHRYRVLRERTEQLSLFRLSERQISSWIAQLSGGISAESGIIVTALPQLAARHGELVPSARPLLPAVSLAPETYVLSTDGHLAPEARLKAETPRFVSVQVPEGPVIAQVEDSTQSRVLWSELLVAQPGIINLVGPY